jgi:hypothetical protein
VGGGITASSGKPVEDILYWNGNLIVIGTFTQVGGSVAVKNIARFDGTSWHAMSLTTDNNTYYALAGSTNYLYVGGEFSGINGVYSSNLLRWNETTWSAVGSAGPNNRLVDMTVDKDGNLYITGIMTSVGGVSVNRIAKWNGTSWSTLGTGLDGFWGGGAITSDGAGNVYVSGNFTTAGGVALTGYRPLAKWDPVTSTWSGFDIGFDNDLNSMSYANGYIFICGYFTTTVSTHFTILPMPNTVYGSFRVGSTNYSKIDFTTNNQTKTLTWSGTYWVVT